MLPQVNVPSIAIYSNKAFDEGCQPTLIRPLLALIVRNEGGSLATCHTNRRHV
jgi:hypothetical protein